MRISQDKDKFSLSTKQNMISFFCAFFFSLFPPFTKSNMPHFFNKLFFVCASCWVKLIYLMVKCKCII